MAQQGLREARLSKKDEFYTRLDDIAKELKFYKPFFKGKVVFCNCDDPYESNFFKFFALNFNSFGLKKLIVTCYNGSLIAGNELEIPFDIPDEEPTRIAYKLEISEVNDYNGDGAVNLADVQYLIQNNRNVLSQLHGNGDFRSSECIELLREADIVVTNPPFSLFREYVAQLVNYQKQFIIIGDTNSLACREIFKLFQKNKIRTGYTNFNVGMFFQVPDDWEKYHHLENGKKMARVSTSCWFTNLPVTKHKEDLILIKKYLPDQYNKYENFNAINVNTYTDIPCDYDGAMGVPITFLDKYNPEQFEIIGLGIATSGLECGVLPYKPEHKKYRKEIQKRGAVDGDLYMMINGEVTVPYTRVLIRRKR